jgi:hypothetical protein
METLDRIDCSRVVYQETDRPVSRALAHDADVEVGNGGKYPADHVGLSSDIFANQAHQRLIIFPAKIRQPLKVSCDGRQC